MHTVEGCAPSAPGAMTWLLVFLPLMPSALAYLHFLPQILPRWLTHIAPGFLLSHTLLFLVDYAPSCGAKVAWVTCYSEACEGGDFSTCFVRDRPSLLAVSTECREMLVVNSHCPCFHWQQGTAVETGSQALALWCPLSQHLLHTHRWLRRWREGVWRGRYLGAKINGLASWRWHHFT